MTGRKSLFPKNLPASPLRLKNLRREYRIKVS